MEQIVLKADINECTLVGWRLNTGEVNARVLNVEMCEYLSGCERQFVTFELADGTVYESLVVGGMAKIPYIEKPQFVKIGLYAENINGDECEKRYSARPANVYVNMGSYTDDSIDPPIPTPGDYSVLLEKFEENKEEVNTALAEIEKGIFKEITSPCHIAELEEGIYIVKGSGVSDYTGKVTFTNVTEDGQTIDDDYFVLNNGLLVVSKNFKETDEDGTERGVISFTAQGLINVPNQSYSEVSGLKQTINNTTSIRGYFLESAKLTESIETFEANKWYSEMPKIVLSDIPASAMISKITAESSIYDFPNAVAVRDYVNDLFNTLQGNLDEVSALVGGA